MPAKRSKWVWGTTVLLAGLLGGCHGSGSNLYHNVVDTLGKTHPVEIVRTQQGSDGALGEPGVWLINSHDELDELASYELVTMNVDFEAHSLVVVALGEQPTGGYGVKIDGVSHMGDELYIYGTAARPGPDAETVMVVTNPYTAAVIAKTSAEVLHPEIDSVMGE